MPPDRQTKEQEDQIENASQRRRRLKNLILAPKTQFRAAVSIFVIGFLFISIVFGVLLYQLNGLIQTLAEYSGDPVQAATATANTSMILLTTYVFVLMSFLCSALYLAFTITHRYLGPMVSIRRFLKQVLAGEPGAKLALRKGDEFTDIAEDLNRLAARLEGKPPIQ